MTKQMIEVIQAHLDGKNIEFRELSASKDWRPAHSPTWNFQDMEYRVAASEPKIPDTIEWEHVAPEFRFMGRGRGGIACLFTCQPFLENGEWTDVGETYASRSLRASVFSSYRRGTSEYSLVERPQP